MTTVAGSVVDHSDNGGFLLIGSVNHRHQYSQASLVDVQTLKRRTQCWWKVENKMLRRQEFYAQIKKASLNDLLQ